MHTHTLVICVLRSYLLTPQVNIYAQAQDCLLPMGVTSENVADRYGVTRREQDQAAVCLHRHGSSCFDVMFCLII